MNIDRRRFVLTAASLAAMPWARRAILPVAHASASPLLCSADMEVDSFQYYETYGDTTNLRLRSAGNTPVISTETRRAGSRSARVYVNRLTSETSYRTEAEATGQWSSFEFQKTYWFGISVFVPAMWAVSSTWEVLVQLHHRPDDWTDKNDFSPVLALRCNPNSDQWRLVQTYVQTPDGAQQQSDLKTAFDGFHGQIQKGRWTDWVFEYRPDWRNLIDGGTGVTRVWRDGVQVVNHEGPNCVNNSRGPYIKFGCYNSAWKDRGFDDPVKERLYFYDEFRVSRANEGSYEAVAPGGDSDRRPMAPVLKAVT